MNIRARILARLNIKQISAEAKHNTTESLKNYKEKDCYSCDSESSSAGVHYVQSMIFF